MQNWQPNASIESLRERANILATIRRFFAERNVMEVDTPLLSSATVTDIHLQSFATTLEADQTANNQNLELFLQTSPEFAMKRLLAAGSGCIYQMGKAFRHELAGRHHNPEFTMLEWYRVGYDDKQLMAEMDQLLQAVLACEPAQMMSYQQAFKRYVGIDPLTAQIEQLKAKLLSLGCGDDWLQQENNIDTLLQFMFAEYVETSIGKQRPCFIYHFPASQAALAKIDNDDPRVARRFEVYFKGIELANGFDELQDASEQRKRFVDDNKVRVSMGLPSKPIDENLLAALQHGLPQCAGVALGVDRLIMLALNKPHLSDVLSFDVNRA
ncbi:elongation factor P--(R)-beta-lysine ligase [Thalassotalea maritima]|uniref:elongation factor P--(R)-beta-lysine ligase n=1 Tax=Thalassotalea maritima TaxID=3242416 RepID=UPI003527BA4A